MIDRYRGAWSSRVNDRYQWLQVTFRRPKKIVAISSQGRQDANQWVTKYWLTYSMDRVHYVYYKQLGVTKVCLFFNLKIISSVNFFIGYSVLVVYVLTYY